MPSTSMALLMTFDTGVPFGTPIHRGGTYTGNGLMVTSYSDFSQIGDPLGGTGANNGFYFHGVNQYIEFKMVGGYRFDLLSLDQKNNHYAPRWVVTSAGAVVNLSMSYPVITEIFSGPGFTDIEWFRVVTAGNATWVDNISFLSSYVSIPDASIMILLGSSLFGLGVFSRKSKIS